MEQNKIEWICSCGTSNTQNFCATCGKKREVALTQAAEEILTANGNTIPNMPLSQNNCQSSMHIMGTDKKNNTVKYLAMLAVALLMAAVGLYAYLSGSEERYVAKSEETQKIVLDVQSAMKDIKELNGDPEAEDTKKYLERLKTGESNLENIQKDLKGMRGSNKYKESNSVLLEALLLERNILQDVESVLKDPLAQDGNATIKRVQDNVLELTQNAAKINIEHTDFSMAFQLGSLADDLNKYVAKKKDLDAKRKAEQLRQAKEVAAARAAAFHKRLNEKNHNLMNTNELVWITTNVNAQGSDLVINGYFYNGTPNLIVKLNSMLMHVDLLLDGEVVVSDAQANFSGIYMSGLLPPGGKSFCQLTIYQGAPNKNFNEFDVMADNLQWLYR